MTICIYHLKTLVLCSFNYNYLLKSFNLVILILFYNIIYYIYDTHVQRTCRETSIYILPLFISEQPKGLTLLGKTLTNTKIYMVKIIEIKWKNNDTKIFTWKPF